MFSSSTIAPLTEPAHLHHIGTMLGTYQACGKTILLGEHVVVYGAPALALPLSSLQTRVDVFARTHADELPFHTDAPLNDSAVGHRLLEAAVNRLGLNERLSQWRVAVSSTIPMGQGLGSSASLSAALVGALAKAADRALTIQEHNEHVFALEEMVHGTPSGIDNTVVTHQAPIVYRKGQSFQRVPWPSNAQLILASSGAVGSTREAVDQVRRWKETHPTEFEAVLGCANEAIAAGLAAFETGELPALGVAMNTSHECLQQLGVSTPALDRLVGAAQEAGALGAKLTGAGMGGFVVALTTLERGPSLETALRQAGATQLIHAGEGTP